MEDQPNILLSAGWDGNLLIWDLREAKGIASIHGPNVSGDGLDYKYSLILRVGMAKF